MPEDALTMPEVKFKTVDIEADEFQDFQVPSYVNYVNVWHFRNDVFIDMGPLTIEQMAASKLDSGAEVRVAMYDRFVMSPITFDELVTRMNLLRDQLKSQGAVQDETFNRSPR